jgi:MATE family multidrug resistance protein
MRRFERLKRRVAPGLRRASHYAKRVTGAVGRPKSGGSSVATMRELVTLAWPIAAAMLGETLLGLVDTKLVGGLGASALGGVGVATTLMFLNYSIIFGVMRGVKVRTAYAVGQGTPEDGTRYARAGVVIGAIVGVLVWLASRDVSWLLVRIGIDAQLVPYARDFFAAVTYGAPATCVLAALINHRQAIGDSRTPMIVGVAGNLVNGFVSYGLIYGRFGLPALGVRGGGYGTALCEWIEVTVMLAVLVHEERNAKRRSTLSLRKAAREVAALGVPTGLHFGAELLAFTTFTAILGSIGVAEIAGHQIAMATIRTSFLPGIAVAEASCILVGRALGKRDLAEADRANRAALLVAATFMALCGIVFAVAGRAIAHGFTKDPEVATIARHLLWVAAVFQVLDGVNIVLRGSLRGAKDVRAAAIIGIIVVWTCVPGAAYFLGKLAGWGAFGGWCGFVAETTVASVLFWIRWSRGAWRDEYATRPQREDRPLPSSAAVLS